MARTHGMDVQIRKEGEDTMRPVRNITAKEENFRTEPHPGCSSIQVVRRDPIEPEPVGTIILVPFKITGYDRDCDGNLMARLSAIDKNGETTGWKEDSIGLYPESRLVVDEKELKELFEGKT